MASPFGDYHNALLTVPGLGSDVVLNSDTGNWELVTGTPVTYKAYLKPGKPQTQPEVGLDKGQVYLTGYLIQPMFFPQSLSLPNRLPCEVKMPNTTIQKGVFEIGLSPASAFGVEAIIGTKIEGWLYVEDGK